MSLKFSPLQVVKNIDLFERIKVKSVKRPGTAISKLKNQHEFFCLNSIKSEQCDNMCSEERNSLHGIQKGRASPLTWKE